MAKKQDDPFFYPVEKVQAMGGREGTPFNFNKGIDHWIVVKTPQGERVVNACSANYTLIPNEEIFKPLEKHMADTFNIELKGHVINAAKFYLDFIIKDKSWDVLPKDSIHPRIRVMNSYDGSLRYSIAMGFWRKICDNGLCIPSTDLKEAHFKMMHTPSALGKWDKIVELTHGFLEKSKELMGGYKELAKHKMTWDQAIQRMADVIEKTRAPKSKGRVERMMLRLQEEKNMGLPLTDWLVYNAINYELNHGDSKQALHKKDKVDVGVLDYMLR